MTPNVRDDFDTSIEARIMAAKANFYAYREPLLQLRDRHHDPQRNAYGHDHQHPPLG